MINEVQKNYVKKAKGKWRVKVNTGGRSYRGTFKDHVAAARYANVLCMKHSLPVHRVPVM